MAKNNMPVTPMMRQYKTIKEQHEGSILLFRMGDFYEMFYSDAEEVSRLLNLTLTQRQGIPMAGIPYHALQNYLPRLLQCGKRVAICEQTELPQKNGRGGISKREVVEVVTPGTVIHSNLLQSSSNNYLQAFGRLENSLGMALLDFSTGEFIATSFPVNSAELLSEILERELLLACPSELLLMEELHDEFSQDFWNQGSEGPGRFVRLCNRIPAWCFSPDSAERKLLEFFGVQSLKGFGFEEQDDLNMGPAFGAAWVILEYLQQNQQQVLGHVQRLLPLLRKEQLQLDSAALRNLEIFQNIQNGGRDYTLYHVLNSCQSAMGTRCLYRWLCQPLLKRALLEQRYDQVEVFCRDVVLRSSIREHLAHICDLERVMGRVSTGKANARDLLALCQSLQLYEKIHAKVEHSGTASILENLLVDAKRKEQLVGLAQLLQGGIVENPPVVLHEGGIIAVGYSVELDNLRSMKADRQGILNAYVEKEQSQIPAVRLKLKYNKVIGYYFEITKNQANQIRIPEHFIRRQSLVNGERYSTEELAELEVRLNSAEEQIVQLERRLFEELRNQVLDYVEIVLCLARQLAELDVLSNFADIAECYNYVRPELREAGEPLWIENGRHPVVERYLSDESFVPNNLELDQERFFALITGPNMAGKSTYLRQNALIVLMAQIGCYVPVKRAGIPMIDRIFCRVGASDNLSRGESTFMVEMQETARILNEASRHSLIIMDEVGRGTSTRDGLAIAQSICEYILYNIQCMTLFATHYHELTGLDEKHWKRLCLAVDENGPSIRFLKYVKEGVIASSYGIHVARLAGIPNRVTQRAEEILQGILKRTETGNSLAHNENKDIHIKENSGFLENRRSKKAQDDGLLFSEPDFLFEELRVLVKDDPGLKNLNGKSALEILRQWINKYL